MSDYEDEMDRWRHPWQCKLPDPPAAWESELAPEARLTLWVLHPKMGRAYKRLMGVVWETVRRHQTVEAIDLPMSPWAVKCFTRGETYALEVIVLFEGAEVERRTLSPTS